MSGPTVHQRCTTLRVTSARRLLSSLALLSLGAAGCAVRNTDMLHFLRQHEHEVSATEYRVGIPDRIAISSPQVAEIDGDGPRIQPDGKINLRLLGEVSIVGMTAREIAAKLEVLASRYYVDPKVRVRVSDFASKKYYVQRPDGTGGPRPYTGRDTVLDAVLAAGADFRSWTTRVTVTRPAHGEEPVRKIQIDIDKMMQRGQWDQNILLEPNDIVYIPPTPGAWLALRVREVLYPVSPVIEAYTTPAYLSGADEVYRKENLDNNNLATRNGSGASFGGYP